MHKIAEIVKKLVAVAVDVKKNPAKYRKAAIVPAAVVVYAVSSYLGADSTVTLDVVAVLTAAGVYGVPNAK